MNELPDKIENESEHEFDLFVIFVCPESSPRPARSIKRVCEITCIPEDEIKSIADRNLWQSRALSYDLGLIKKRKKASQDPSHLVANALLKLAGQTLTGTAPTGSNDEETISKAVKLVEGYRKLK